MTKKYLLTLLVFVGAGLVYFNQHTRRTGSVAAQTPSKKIVKELLNAPADLSVKILPRDLDGSSRTAAADCAHRAVNSLNVSFDRLLELIMDGSEPLLDHCDKTQSDLSAGTKQIAETCVRKVDLSIDQKQKCLTYIALYRARLIDLVTDEEPDLRSLSDSVLLNKAFAIFNDSEREQQAQRNAKKLDEVADELLRRRPDWDFPLKVKIATRLMTSDPGGLLALAQSAYSQHPNDSEFLDSAFFAYAMQGANDKLQAKAQAHIQLRPDDPIGYYWAASAYQSAGDLNNSIEALKKAAELDPTNKRYTTALEKVVKGTGDTALNFEFKLPFDEL